MNDLVKQKMYTALVSLSRLKV